MATQEEIKAWQDKLFAAFSHDDVLGGRVLMPTLELEGLCGEHFVRKYHGHRVLMDAFMDFFGQTILEQIAVNQVIGWPADRPSYTLSVFMYLTLFRSLRAAEVVSVNGYPLQAYVLQRSVKDQVFVLAAAANNFASFNRLFGWEEMPYKQWGAAEYAKNVENRRTVEGQVRDFLIGKKSGLSERTHNELLRWDQMFNWEAHRGLVTFFSEVKRITLDKKVMGLVAEPDEMDDAMYVNRATEVCWMIHRVLPFMRRSETPKNEEWDRKWTLLDESFRWMTEAQGAMEKPIAFAFIELIDKKFQFGPATHFSESSSAKSTV
jgi:hypothetical protein